MSQIRSQTYLKTTQTEATSDSLINKMFSDGDYLEASKLANSLFSNFYSTEKNYKKAIKYALVEVENLEKLDSVNQEYSLALYNLGIAYSKIKDYSNSLKYHFKVVDLNHSEAQTIQSYYEIGRNYYRLGDYYKAEEFYKKNTSYYKKQKDYNNLINKYFALVRVYNRIDTESSHAQQFLVLKELETLKTTVAFSTRQSLSFYNYLANYYNNPYSYDFEKSKYYFTKNLELALKEKNTAFICASCTNLGDLYNVAKKEGALPHLEKSLLYCNDETFYYTYHQMSSAYLNQNKLDKALQYINKSIKTFNLKDSLSNIPSALDFESVSDKINLMLSLDRKAEIYIKYYENTEEKAYIEKALQSLTLIDELIDVIENNELEEQSQLYWRKNASKTYAKAIKCAHILGKSDLAFYFMEKSKALLLTESILSHAVAVSLPKDAIKKEKTYRKKISKLGSDIKDQQSQITKDSLFDLKFEYQKFTDSLKLKFPEYYKNKSKTQLFSLANTKKQLDNHTVVISYNWDTSTDNNTIHGLVFSNSFTQNFTLDNSNKIEEAIKAYSNLLSRVHNTKKDSEDYRLLAHSLFNSLFPIEIEQQIKEKHLIIIPDGYLQNLPFEALISNNNNYLIETNEVSYAYSMSFLFHNKTITRNTTKDFVGFAPINFNHNQLNKLPKTEDELYGIQSKVGGENYLLENATKKQFLDNSSQSNIIHLATHADASNNPWIGFYDKKMELNELYNHKINADLAILSACNTSLGEQYKGEGVFSLARGFFYSGANSVISSLWNVNDKSTSFIMEEFYKNLKNGNTKSQALRQAKLDYINSHELSQAAPYYWSSFILIGDHGKTSLSSNSFFLYYLLGVLIVLIIGYLLFQQKNKKLG